MAASVAARQAAADDASRGRVELDALRAELEKVGTAAPHMPESKSKSASVKAGQALLVIEQANLALLTGQASGPSPSTVILCLRKQATKASHPPTCYGQSPRELTMHWACFAGARSGRRH